MVLSVTQEKPNVIKVECPSCSASYDLDEKRLPASGLRMRCPKCGASFQVAPDGSVGEAGSPSAAPRKKTEVGIGVAPPPPKKAKLGGAGSATAALLAELEGGDEPAAAKPAYKPPAPPPPPPPPSSDSIDLPAPSKKKMPMPGIPKPRRAAPPDLDLPAPKPKKRPLAPPVPSVPSDLDLPAPKAKKRPIAPPVPSDLDLPAPKAKKKPLAPPVVDLPAAKAARKPGGFDDLDLPAPKSARGKPAPPDFDDLDLPTPLTPSGKAKPAKPAAKRQDDFDLDLPTPAGGGGFGDLDLPAPRGTAPRGSTPFDAMMSDLPAPAGVSDELDLPMPKGGDDLDLPMPKHSGGGGGFGDLDLPMPKPTGSSSDDFDLDLPMPATGVDLPAPSGSIDLPTPSGGVDLPMPSGGADLPVLSDGMDLPTTSDGLDLPTPRADFAGAPAATDLDLLLPGDDGTGMGMDDLSLPSPRSRGDGAGSDKFGEIDLGGGDGQDSLEFDDIDGGGDEPDLDAVGGMDLPDDAADPTKGPQKRDTVAPPKKSRGAWYAMGVLVLLVGAGVGARWTPYGIFGVHFFEQFTGAAGDDAAIHQIIVEAEEQGALDTYEGVRQSLRTLSDARKEYYLNRTLLARSALHEALFQHRFGENARAAGRERAILERLATRGDDAPGILLARAASELRQGNASSASAKLAGARSESPNDPYVNLIAAEIAYATGDYQSAATEFQAAADAGIGARGTWGVARAKRMLNDHAGFAEAAAATLEASPDHAGALVAVGEQAFNTGQLDRALEYAQRATSSRASGAEKAAAYGLLGRVHEARGRRGAAREAYEAAVAASPFDHESLLGLGRVLLEERRFGDALARFQGAQQTIGDRTAPEGAVPYDIQVGIGMTRAHVALSEPEQAHAIMSELGQAHPDDPDVQLWLGKAFQARQQYAQAVRQYERVIALDETRFDGYLAAAQLFFERDQPERAGEVLNRARSKVEVTSEVRRLLGESELRRNRLPEAIQEFQGALALDSENTHALFGLARAFRRSGRLDEANQKLERLGSIDSTYPGLALERGRVYEAQGHPERAVTLYERALADSPDDLSLVLRLGAAQLAAEQIDQAAETIQRVLDAEPQNAEALHFMGRVAFERGEYQSAQELLSRAIALDPATGEYHMWMAWTYLEQSNLSRALEEVSRSLEIDDSLAEAYYVRGRVGLRGGAVRDAAEDFNRALQMRPSLTDALAGLAECYDQLGESRRAISSYEQAVAREPRNGFWQYRLGTLRQESGRGAEAMAALRLATELGDALRESPPWLAEAHRLMGNGHRRSGENNAAIDHYERYMELAPQSAIDREQVRDILSRLRR